MSDQMGVDPSSHPLTQLERHDLDLAMELVLKGGSLKDLAAEYGVSYPTIRGRVNRLIERLRAVIAGRSPDPLSDLLDGLVERGEMSAATARLVRAAARDAADPGREPADPLPAFSPAADQPLARRFDWRPRSS